MNWKTVFFLLRVDMKSGRLIRGQKLVKYNTKRSKTFAYLPYAAAITIGTVAGLLIGLFFSTQASETGFQFLFKSGFSSFMISLPTIVLVFTLIFSMLQQIQRTGASQSQQVPYWLPVTWKEHTLASILANVLGLPILTVMGLLPAVLIISAYTGQLFWALGAVFMAFIAAFMAGSTTETLRILQTRFIGSIYKSTGRAAIWVRFAGSLIFFIIFYVVYFYVTTGSGFSMFIQSVNSVQNSAWFVPFVWLGMTLYSLMSGLIFQGLIFLLISLLFVYGLFYLGVFLNTHFGLYEPPAITVSRGTYTPKAGVLGKFGLSSLEAALIHKDIRAFTRRRELMATFIGPIVFLLIPIMSSLNTGSTGSSANMVPVQFWFAFTSLFPVSIMAMSIGSYMTGEEGQNIWRIYSLPISAKSFVKSKFVFTIFFSLLILPVTGLIGAIIYQPSLRVVITLVLEAVFVAFAAGALSLANGIKGADFSEVPKPRMIRAQWSLINMLTCLAASLLVLLPLFPYLISVFVPGLMKPFLELYQAVALSAGIACVLTGLFYSVAVSNAKDLLSKAQA
jgi:hypothetical protein